MATRRRVKITNNPAPYRPRQVERGGSRTPVNPDVLRQDQNVLLSRRGGFSGNQGWVSPNPEAMPQSLDDNYTVSEQRALRRAAKQGGWYNNANLNVTPDFSLPREHEEGYRFSESDNDQGNFIPLTYYPTKTSWPANGYDHRRTIAAGYSRDKGILRIQFFTDGSVYDYGTENKVPEYVARQFRLTQSPGRAIHGGPGWAGPSLESYGYTRIQ